MITLINAPLGLGMTYSGDSARLSASAPEIADADFSVPAGQGGNPFPETDQCECGSGEFYAHCCAKMYIEE